MNTRYRPLLALLAAALVTLMCGSASEFNLADHRGTATCTVQNYEPLGSTYTDDFVYNGDDCVVPEEPKDEPKEVPTPDDGTPGP